MIVPFDQLSPETLDALIEEFLTRDGSVQGHYDAPVEKRVEQVKKLLRTGKVVIHFDEEDESCTIAEAQ